MHCPVKGEDIPINALGFPKFPDFGPEVCADFPPKAHGHTDDLGTYLGQRGAAVMPEE